MGLDPVGGSSDELGRRVARDIEKWTAVAKAANIRNDLRAPMVFECLRAPLRWPRGRFPNCSPNGSSADANELPRSAPLNKALGCSWHVSSMPKTDG